MKIKILSLVALLSMMMDTSIFAQLKPVNYSDGNQKLNGISSRPKKQSKQKAGILILPAWMGIDKHAKETALKLNDLGYHCFIADIYGEGNYPKNQGEASKMASFYKTNTDAYVHRIQLALDQLIKSGADPSRIVVIGYCFGGTGALNAARENMPVKGVVSFHGGLGKDTNRVIKTILPKVLVCHGANDFYIPASDISAFQNEMKQSKADWQMIYYANAVHAFTDPAAGNDPSGGAAYHEQADKRSWKHMIQFLNEIL
jgi:dienelactone hydrolase